MSGSRKNTSAESMHDRASVPGVGSGRPNRRRRPTKSAIKRGGLSMIRSIGKMVLGVCAGLAMLVGTTALIDWAKTAPEWAIDTINVHGTGRASKEAVLRLAGIVPGENIFKLDAAEVERQISSHPWVATAKVSRKFPRTIAIDVTEHVPVVLVALGHLYYADHNGEIVKRLTPGEREQLPVVTGLTRESVERDDGDAKGRLVSAIAFLDALQAAAKAGVFTEAPAISEIHLDPVLGLSFVTSEDDTTVVLGQIPVDAEGWKRSIERYVRVRGALVDKGVKASRIVVGGERRPDRVVARLSSRVPQEGARTIDGQLEPSTLTFE